MHSYGEKEEKRKGNWLVPMGTVLILYSRHTRIVQVQVRGPKTEYLVDLLFIRLPHGSKDGHSLHLKVVFTVFEYFVLSIIKKGVFATVDILVNSQDWMVKELSISAMADDGGNVYDDKYDKYDRRCKLIILPSLDPQHSANP